MTHIKYPLWLPFLIWASFSKQCLPNLQFWKSFHALITSSCSFWRRSRHRWSAEWKADLLVCVCLPAESRTSSFAKTSEHPTRTIDTDSSKTNHRGKNSQECQIVSRFYGMNQARFSVHVRDIYIYCIHLGLSQLLFKCLFPWQMSEKLNSLVSVMAWE